MVDGHRRWVGQRRSLSADSRALGLAFTHALRPASDCEKAAVHIATVAGPGAIGLALAKVRFTMASRPSAVGERAEQALTRALELREGEVVAEPAGRR